MARICSNWRLTLDPGGSAETLVLDFAQRIDGDELELPWTQATQQSPRPGAAGMRNFGRANVQSGIGLTTFETWADDATARNACLSFLSDLSSNFGGETTTLRIDVSGGDTYEIAEVVVQEAARKPVARASATAETSTRWRFLGGLASQIVSMLTEGGDFLLTESGDTLLSS